VIVANSTSSSTPRRSTASPSPTAHRAPGDQHAQLQRWGGLRAAVTAVLRSGRRVVVGAGGLPRRHVRGFEIRSAHGGYRVSAVWAPRGSSARIVRPARQSSNPLPGPSLAIKLSERSIRRLAAVTARITPARSGPLARP
jgi:hypothetical protein